MLKKVVFAFVMGAILLPSVVSAQDNDSKKIQIMALPAGEVVDHDYFAAGEVVEVSGTVNGDVYAAGGQVIIDGTINGDLLVAGGAVTISGDVTGNVRSAGGQVLFTGEVGRNVSAVGGTIEFTDTAKIGGSIAMGAGSVVLNAPVGGDINAGVGNLRLGSSAVVAGNINYASEEEISRSETASVSGVISRTITPQYQKPSKEAVDGFFSGLGLFTKLSSIITSLVIGFLMIRFLPNYVKGAAELTTKRFLPSLAVGFLGLIVVSVLAIVLLFTLLGIPLALLLGATFFVYLYVVRIYAMFAIGQKIAELLKTKTNSYWLFLFGLVAYYALSIIPVVGFIVKALVLIASFGTALINEKAIWEKASKAKIF